MVLAGWWRRLLQLTLPSTAPVAKRNVQKHGNHTVAIHHPTISNAGLSLTSSRTLDLMALVAISSVDLSSHLLNPCERGDLLLPLCPTEDVNHSSPAITRATGSIPAAATSPAAAAVLSGETETALGCFLLTKAPVIIHALRLEIEFL